MPTRQIPVIAGAENNRFWSFFSSRIRRSAPDGTPLEGSFGISFDIKDDMRGIAARFQGNRNEMVSFIRANYTRKGKEITKHAAEMAVDFYLLAVGNQEYFFLRKGHDILGLYRKTSSYSFDQENRYPHRLNYQFVRSATDEERRKSLHGRMTPTLIWWNADIPAEPAMPAIEAPIQQLVATHH